MTTIYWTLAVLFTLGTLVTATQPTKDRPAAIGQAISVAVNVATIWLLVHAAINL